MDEEARQHDIELQRFQGIQRQAQPALRKPANTNNYDDWHRDVQKNIQEHLQGVLVFNLRWRSQGALTRSSRQSYEKFACPLIKFEVRRT